MFTMLSNKTINQNEDSTILVELCKMMNFRLNRTSDYLYPSKDLFFEVKNHCLQTLLYLINEENHIANGQISVQKTNNFKAFVMPHNNGKLVSAILKRRVWWKILK